MKVYSWLRSRPPWPPGRPLLIVLLLAVGGYILTSRVLAHDRASEAMRRADIGTVDVQGALADARAYVANLGSLLGGEHTRSESRFASLAASASGSLGLTDTLWVQSVSQAERQAYEQHLRAPIVRLVQTPGPGQISARFVPAPVAASYLSAAFTSETRQELRPGVDVSGWAGLAAAIRNRVNLFAVGASRAGALGRDPGFYLVEEANYGGGTGRHGFLAVFVPSAWLTAPLQDDPRLIAIYLAGQRLGGGLNSAASGHTRFDLLGQQWSLAIGKAPPTAWQSAIPWIALAWPFVGALLVWVVARGIFARRRAEAEFERMFRVSRDLLCVAGVDGTLKRVNPALERTLGYSTEELRAARLEDLVHPDELGLVREASRRLRDGQEIVEAEGRVIRADGQALWLEVNARPIPDEQVFYAAARDVTERHIAEERLREAQRLIEASRDELRVLADEQAALRRVATLVARGGSPSAVFAAVAEELGHVMHDAAHAFVGRYHGDVAMEIVGAWSRTGDSGIGGSHMNLGGRNVSTLVFKSKRPARVDRFPQDDESAVTAVARAIGSRSSAGAPIVVEGQLWGLMIVGSAREDTLAAGTEHRLAEFTELVATAIANTQAQAELTASRARIVTTADDTRRRIVRDLHDGAQQRLVQAIVTLNLAQRALNEGNESGRGLVVEALAQARLANAELRELAHGILPNVLTRGGLSAGVEALVSRLRVPVTVNVVHERFPSEVEATAYFVVAEALTNVAKHADAESAHVTAWVDDGVLQVDVRDDGIGGARPDGHGLLGLDDRVTALGGVLRIESPPDGGTRIAATLPLQD